MNKFISGKLYRPTDEVINKEFPNNNGLRNSLFYHSGEDLSNPYHIPEPAEACVMLVLEVLYTQRYRKQMKKGMVEPITIYMRHMKVIINEQVGYISQWEDEWVEIK